jgi:hypothetical protein
VRFGAHGWSVSRNRLCLYGTKVLTSCVNSAGAGFGKSPRQLRNAALVRWKARFAEENCKIRSRKPEFRVSTRYLYTRNLNSQAKFRYLQPENRDLQQFFCNFARGNRDFLFGNRDSEVRDCDFGVGDCNPEARNRDSEAGDYDSAPRNRNPQARNRDSQVRNRSSEG